MFTAPLDLIGLLKELELSSSAVAPAE
jgi:hypothetical protein